MGKKPIRLLLIVILSLSFALTALQPVFAGDQPPVGTQEYRYFPETTKASFGKILTYWNQHGGLARFGYPITEVFSETNEQTHQAYQVQYFERARFELHPEFAGTPYEVLLGLLGVTVTKNRLNEEPFKPIDDLTPYPSEGKFVETHHTISKIFYGYWQLNGGLAVFGYPISQAFKEKSNTDGKEHLVQYFQRNRIEFHTNVQVGDQYQLGLLGNDLLKRQIYTYTNLEINYCGPWIQENVGALTKDSVGFDNDIGNASGFQITSIRHGDNGEEVNIIIPSGFTGSLIPEKVFWSTTTFPDVGCKNSDHLSVARQFIQDRINRGIINSGLVYWYDDYLWGRSPVINLSGPIYSTEQCDTTRQTDSFPAIPVDTFNPIGLNLKGRWTLVYLHLLSADPNVTYKLLLDPTQNVFLRGASGFISSWDPSCASQAVNLYVGTNPGIENPLSVRIYVPELKRLGYIL